MEVPKSKARTAKAGKPIDNCFFEGPRFKENCFCVGFIGGDFIIDIDRTLLFARPPVLSATLVKENCFSLSFIPLILPDLAEGVNRQVLPVFGRFCPITKTVGGRQRPSGQAMREKQRDSGANRAGGGQCRAEARFQTSNWISLPA
jgi:hypothetical protein